MESNLTFYKECKNNTEQSQTCICDVKLVRYDSFYKDDTGQKNPLKIHIFFLKFLLCTRTFTYENQITLNRNLFTAFLFVMSHFCYLSQDVVVVVRKSYAAFKVLDDIFILARVFKLQYS